MKVTVLDGGGVEEAAGSPAVELEAALARAGAQMDILRLRDIPLAYCQGEFDCWIKTPGLCRAHDRQIEIARAVHDSDLVFLATPVTFGGYSSELKKGVDRLIGLVEPFFTVRDGHSGHRARYARYPALYGLGWTPEPNEQQARLFEAIVARNSLNFLSPRWGSLVVSKTDADRSVRIARWSTVALEGGAARSAIEEARLSEREILAPCLHWSGTAKPKTVLLVGSARVKGTSNSESLGRELLSHFEAAGVSTDVVHVIRFLHDGPAREEAIAKVLEAELLVVASPTYVDALPYLVVRTFELLARRRLQLGLRSGRLMAIVNCGFPEADHCLAALAVAREFALGAGYDWAGGLALGGGEAIKGRPMSEVAGTMRFAKRALSLAAEALLDGRGVPEEAAVLMGRPFVPPWAYRFLGSAGWRLDAFRRGIRQRDLDARPLDAR